MLAALNTIWCRADDEASAAAIGLIDSQSGLPIAGRHSRKDHDEEREVQMNCGDSWINPSLLSHRGANADSPMKKALQRMVRDDDAPGVLSYVADGATPEEIGEVLRSASAKDSMSVVRELVATGVCVNDLCPRTRLSALQMAALAGHNMVCEILLDAMADVHRSVGGTALSLAKKMGNAEVEEVIERHISQMLLSERGEGVDDMSFRRAHVMPRISPILSHAMLQSLPAHQPQDWTPQNAEADDGPALEPL